MDSYSPQQYFYKLENMLLNSSQVLRKLFQLHWKTTTGKPWEETEQQGKEFIDGVGQSIYKDATKKQKRFISKGLLSEWDLLTLSSALELFRNAEHEDDKSKSEYKAIMSLKRLSNELSRHPTKKFFKKEFNRRLDTFRASLRALQVKEERIEIMVEKAGVTSSQTTLESFNKLIAEGEKELKSNEFIKALDHFQMATSIPSLLLVYQGIAFEKRAECYVILLTNQNKQYVNQTEAEKYKVPAFFDAKQALECNDESWKAHHLLAQLCASYKKLDEAFEHCEAALILAPEQTQLKTYLNYLKTLKGWLNLVEVDSFRIPFLPVPLTEYAIQIKAEEGIIIKLTEEQMRVVQKSGVFKGQEEVIQGNAYARGLTVSQNYEEAVRFYKKAAEVKNAAGMYTLGYCYFYGLGIQMSLEKAHELFLEAANFPASISVPASNFCVENFGVSDSQFTMASFYLEGRAGGLLDFSEATKWFKKSAENGNEMAAGCLGAMHIVGIGIPRNYRIGETYLKQAVNLGYYKAAQKLFKTYDSCAEPDRAREMREKLKGQDFIKVTKSDEIKFMERYKAEISLRKEWEQDILEYEAKNNVDGSNMLFSVRHHLYESCGISMERIFKFLKEAQSTSISYNLWFGGSFKWDDDDMLYEKLVKLLYDGSPSAAYVMDSLQSNYKLWTAITQIKTENTIKGDSGRLIKLMFEGFLCQFLYATDMYLPPDGVTILKSFIAKLFERKFVGNNGKKSEEDKRIRFCYAYVQILRSLQGEDISAMMVDILKEGIEMYPDSNPSYNLLTYLHLHGLNHEAGLYYAKRGLEKLPDDKQLLFARAKHFSMLPNSDREQIVDNYKMLLKVNPPDYWQMPDAYYSIANVYRLSFAADENNNKTCKHVGKIY